MKIIPGADTVDGLFQRGDIRSAEQVYTDYKIDRVRNTLSETVEGLEALVQAVEKELMTEKGLYPIYSHSYGVKTADLVGLDKDLAVLKLKNRIENCLEKYKRITEVSGFRIVDAKDDTVTVAFEVDTIYGKTEAKKVISV